MEYLNQKINVLIRDKNALEEIVKDLLLDKELIAESPNRQYNNTKSFSNHTETDIDYDGIKRLIGNYQGLVRLSQNINPQREISSAVYNFNNFDNNIHEINQNLEENTQPPLMGDVESRRMPSSNAQTPKGKDDSFWRKRGNSFTGSADAHSIAVIQSGGKMRVGATASSSHLQPDYDPLIKKHTVSEHKTSNVSVYRVPTMSDRKITIEQPLETVYREIYETGVIREDESGGGHSHSRDNDQEPSFGANHMLYNGDRSHRFVRHIKENR
jgi:hypothetical protein